MRIAFVSPSFHPAYAYGGPINSTLGMAQGLARLGSTIRVLTTNANASETLRVDTSREHEVSPGVWVRYAPRCWGTTSPQLVRLLPEYLKWSEVVHLSGVYSFPTLPTLTLAKGLDVPVMWSLHGSLQRWRGTKHRAAKIAWELACRSVRPPRLVLHATAQDEASKTALRMPGVPIVVVPNGVDVPPPFERVAEPGVLRLLFLGRLDPIKGIENLLEACALLGTDWSWRLTIAGAGTSAYTRALEDLVRRLGLASRVRMVGAVDAEARQRLFAESDLLVLPSHSENFGLVVVEALAHGVPVIASRGTPWSDLEREGCGLWVDNAPTELAKALERARGLPLEEMGAVGRRYAIERYAWQRVCERLLEAMRSLVGAA